MHAILSASVGQEQLLTELLVTYTKVSLHGSSSDPRARPSALNWACLVDNVHFWNKRVKNLLYFQQKCLTGGLPVLLFKKIKGQAVVFLLASL